MKTFLSIACLLVACHASWADTLKANPSPAKAAGTKVAAKAGPVVDTKPGSGKAVAPAAKVYAVAKRAVFTASPNDHNPCWPIGWVKMESASESAASVIPHTEDFIVTSILLNEPPMAVINGKEMAEGEIATLSINGQPVMVQLMAVQDGRVILRWQNQNIVVPLHRDEQLSTPDTTPPVALLR